MFAVAPHAVLQPIGAANANENARFPKIIDLFAAEPEPARELFAGDEVGLGAGHNIRQRDRSWDGWDLGLG
jgi:hypothetical protein